jgi:hypothetical protein
MGMQVHADSLFGKPLCPCADPGTEARRSVVQLALSCPKAWGSCSITREPLGFPGRRDPSISAWGRAPRHGIQSTREVSCENTHNRVLAAQHGLGDLARGLASQREQEHLVTCARFGVGAFARRDGATRLVSAHPMRGGL